MGKSILHFWVLLLAILIQVVGISLSHTQTIDTVAPVDFTTGVVTVVGGEVQTGYWNGSNSVLTVSVPIADDASLTGGMVQVQGKAGSGSYSTLGSVVALSSGDLAKDKVITVSSSQLAGHPNYGQGAVLSFRAVLTDLAGNKKDGSVSSTTLTIDTIIPVDFTTGVVTVVGGEVQAGYWNGSNSGLTVSVPIADDVSLRGGTVQIQGKATGTGECTP